MRITQFMRRPRPHAFSIERLYCDIRDAMPPEFEVSVWTCRNPSSGVVPRVKDMWAARRGQADVNHITGDVHYLTFLLDKDRTILTVHDLVSFRRLRGVKRWLLWFLWYWLPVRRSRVVVTVSEATRNALLGCVRCDPKKIRVIHNSVSDEFQPVERPFNSDCPRILQIGTKDNKNLGRVAAALEGIDCRLAIVGPLADAQVALLHRHGIDFENHVALSREALCQLYVETDLLMFASTYEGFGMPIVEAQAVGRPVITSGCSSMQEVAGGAACLVDPFDVSSIRAGVLSVVRDAEYRKSLLQAGFRNAARFKSDIVAQKYANLYKEISESSFR